MIVADKLFELKSLALKKAHGEKTYIYEERLSRGNFSSRSLLEQEKHNSCCSEAGAWAKSSLGKILQNWVRIIN
jgi:hypothetical protein